MARLANKCLRRIAYTSVFGRRSAYAVSISKFRRNVFDILFALLYLVSSNRCIAQIESPANVPWASTTSQSTIAPSFQNTSGEEILGDAVYIYPASQVYPAGLASQGTQGLVILLLDLTPDGHVKSARIHTSSRVEALDAAAMRKAQTMTYQGRGAPPSTVSLRVDFRRDSVESLQTKSCVDFNVDVAWFRNTFPGRPEIEMPILQMTSNMVRLNVGTWHHEHKDPVLQALPVALDATVRGCEEFPARYFKDIFNRALTTASDAGIRNLPMNDKFKSKPPCATTNSCTDATAGLPRSILRTNLDEPVWTNDQHVTPNMAAYPAELANAGIQGQVVLQVSLTAQGEISNIDVQHNQSGNKALADAGVAYANKLSFQQFIRSDSTPVLVIVPVEFDKDTEASLPTKTCADFDIDVSAWQLAHPKADVRSMRAMGVSMGIINRLAFEHALDYKTPFTITPELANKVAVDCRANPKSLFMDVLKQQLRIAAVSK